MEAKLCIHIGIACLIALTSCSKNIESLDKHDSKTINLNITASVPQTNGTKLVFTDEAATNKMKVGWGVNDYFYMHDASTLGNESYIGCSYQGTVGASSGPFRCVGVPNFSIGDHIFAIFYPIDVVFGASPTVKDVN